MIDLPVTPLRWLDPTHVRFGRRTLLAFAGCNYLGLSWHSNLRRAVEASTRRGPLHPGASRATTGEHASYLVLEQELAGFCGPDAALLCATGYLATLAAFQGLAGQFTHVFLAAGAHACGEDGARLAGRPVQRFERTDLIALHQQLRRLPAGSRPLVADDGVFGSRGGVAPVADYLELLPPDGWLLVDDAHGLGTVGRGGRGTAAAAGLLDPRLVQIVSLAKALGAAGGAILGSQLVIASIRARAAAFVGSTASPLPMVSAARTALRMLRRAPGRVGRLQRYCRQFHGLVSNPRAHGHGFPVLSDPRTPVSAVHPPSAAAAEALRAALLAAGIYPSWIRYLGGPSLGFFRFALNSEHQPDDVARLAGVLKETPVA